MDSFFHLDTPHVEPCSRACPPNAKRTIHQSALSDSQHSAKRVHVKRSTHHAPSQGLLPEAEWAVMQLQVYSIYAHKCKYQLTRFDTAASGIELMLDPCCCFCGIILFKICCYAR